MSVRRVLLNLFLVLMSVAGGAQHIFQINNFQATAGDLSLCGQAEYHETRLRLSSARPEQQGAAWYKTSKLHLANGFETEFTFLISSSGGPQKGGDGFAFVIQNQASDILGGTGNDKGYKGIPYGLAIEFDTKDDNEGSRNHVNLSFYNPATGAYRRYATVHEIPEITDGNAHFTRIIYNDGRLEVYLDSYLFPILSVRIDIAETIRSPEAWIGFTSGTSSSYANHDLLEWSLRAFDPPPDEIRPENVAVTDAHVLQVRGRKLTVRVWDHNVIDGDIVSLKWGDKWVLTEYSLVAEPKILELTLHGFSEKLTVYAHNVGMVPPNTVAISVFDGHLNSRFVLNSDLETSEALVIQYVGEEER